MKRGRRAPLPALRWTWILDSPLVLATWVTVLLGAWSMQQVSGALSATAGVRRGAGCELARLAAEAAVMQVSFAATERSWERAIGDVVVRIERRKTRLVVASELPSGEVHTYSAKVVRGESPAAFGKPFSNVVPELEPAVLQDKRPSAQQLFRRDDGVALLNLDGGTDLDDFVFDVARAPLADLSVGVVVVPGHLWIESGARPLELSCDRDLTIVVMGNLYLGRCIEVLGPGRIVFVTKSSESARPFADLDGNGRRSPAEAGATPGATPGAGLGVPEGGGNVYLGLQTSRADLAIGVGLVVAGRLHLWRDARVAGPVVSGGPPIAVLPGARLVAAGERMFRPEREAVPGFLATGAPRAGLLCAIGAATEAGDEQALYLTGSAR